VILQLCSPALYLPGFQLLQKFSGNFHFRPEKSGRTNFRPAFFWIFKISTGNFLRFSTFAAKFFRQKKFRGQKKCGFPDAMASVPENGLRRWCQSVAKLTTFFPTFAPTFFYFFNFRPENF